jgi:hypothetical protein
VTHVGRKRKQGLRFLFVAFGLTRAGQAFRLYFFPHSRDRRDAFADISGSDPVGGRRRSFQKFGFRAKLLQTASILFHGNRLR